MTKIKYRLHCSTCPATIEMPSSLVLPENWERDRLGEAHCGKCMRLARAVMSEDRRRINGNDE